MRISAHFIFISAFVFVAQKILLEASATAECIGVVSNHIRI